MSSEPSSGSRGLDSMSIDLAMPWPYMPSALTVRSVSGLSTASDNQSWLGLRRHHCHRRPPCAGACPAGRLPPSVMEFITEISAMPSAMQWWMRRITAQPPS